MEDDDVTVVKRAVDRLTPAQRQLVGLCLKAIVERSYIERDGEFHSVMGVWRDEAVLVATMWPEIDPRCMPFLVVNNTLVNLLGFPHGQWATLSELVGLDEQAAKTVLTEMLTAWREEIPAGEV
jgi:hypothetical protein